MEARGQSPIPSLRLKPEIHVADRKGVDGAPQHGALAELAAGLSQQLQAQLVWMAQALAGHWPRLEKSFRRRLKELGYTAPQAASLEAITPGAAGGMLASGKSLADFLEQLRYRARRLAKLDLSPGQVLAALREYDHLLDEAVGKLFAGQEADLRWARNQLHFLVVLALNDAYYQVRDAESRTFYELFRAQTESGSLEQLWERCLDILKSFSGAAEAGIFLFGPGQTWVAAAGMAEWKGRKLSPPSAVRRRLAAPRVLSTSGGDAAAVLGPGWKERFVTVWSVPMQEGTQLRGVLQFAFPKPYEWLPRELGLLQDAAARCWQAAEKARLLEELAERERQIRQLAEHMVEVEEAERRRISRELHDEAGQSLLYTRLQLEMLEQQIAGSNPQLEARLRQLRETVEHSILEIRRLIGALSPAVLEQMGLAAALRQLAARFRQIHPAEVRVQIPRRLDLPRKTEIIVYRLVQEALNNAAKYSLASRVNLSVETADGVLRLDIEDDGAGFDVEEALSRQDCYGLSGLRERVALLGGTLEVQSTRKATREPEVNRDRSGEVRSGPRTGAFRHGTRIRVILPIGEAGEAAHGRDRARRRKKNPGSAKNDKVAR